MNENILKELRPSILGYLPRFVPPMILLFVTNAELKPYSYSVFWILEFLIFFGSLLKIFSTKYKIGTTHIEVEELLKNGLSLDRVVIEYSGIQEIRIQQNPFQRIFQTGDLLVETAGVGHCVLKGIEDPDGVMKYILELKGAIQ
jgi:uncharacterized membrane protein YdbT with pleckstrin-like domain